MMHIQFPSDVRGRTEFFNGKKTHEVITPDGNSIRLIVESQTRGRFEGGLQIEEQHSAVAGK